MDMGPFSTLTKQLVTTLEKNNIEKTNQVMVHYCYESIVIRDTLEYVKDLKEYQPGLKNEDTEQVHIHNIICSFEIFRDTYCLLKDMDQPFIENILLHIKTKTEIMVKSNTFKEDLMVFPYLSWMNEIISQTDRSTLLRVFDKLDYYRVLTRLIRNTISKNCHPEEGFILVGNLSDIDVLDQCPFLEDQRNSIYGLLEDFIFTNINHQIDDCFYYLLGIEIVNYNTAAVLYSFIKWLQVFTRITQKEITRNGGERAISLFDAVRDRLLQTINGDILCLPLAESIQMILLAVCCKRMISLAPLLIKFLNSILKSKDITSFTIIFWNYWIIC